MPAILVSRRELVKGLTAFPASLGSCAAPGATTRTGARSSDDAAVSHSSESIHQEVHFNASRERLYGALTDPRKFDALTRLSDAVTLVTAPDARPTAISSEVGGPFTLFGGYVTGRHLEMQPNERLVQAWRAGSWPAGAYSIASFALVSDKSGCRIVFDHRGFPDGQGSNLSYGWRVHYWEPLAKLVAKG